MNEKNQSYIQSVVLEGYKSIQHTEIDFEQGLNIIIGKNGSGKTNFLEFLKLILEKYPDKLSNFKFSTTYYYNRQEKNVVYFWSMEKKTNNSYFKYLANQKRIEDAIDIEISLKYKVDNDTKIDRKFNNSKEDIIKGLIILEFFNNSLNYGFPVQSIQYALPQGTVYLGNSISLYRQSPAVYVGLGTDLQVDIITILKRVALTAELDTFQKEHNIDDYLNFNIKENNLNLFKEFFWKNLNEALKDYIKELYKFSPIKNIRLSDKIKFNLENDLLNIQQIQYEFYVNDYWYTWDSLSDGTKRIFILITNILSYDDGSLILLEEPELGIHPHQLHLLMQFLKEQSETKQIILTTHSPQVLDILNVNELNKIIIAEMTEEGTKLRHLTEKQKKKAARYMEDLFLSDYWVQNAGLEDEQE